jgi:hypothetical protein
VVLSVTEIGASGRTVLLDKGFDSGAAAAAYFNGNLVGLGAYTGRYLQVDLSVTSDSAHAGFYGGLLIGG